MSARPTMEARFESTCASCLERIYEGENIGLIEPDGEWCHLECAEEEPWDD